MAQIINTNNMSLNAQRNLTTSSNALATTIQRLSSGLRINSAKDDAAGLAISERFTTQIRGMNQAARNANDGISLAQTAEGALAEISNNLQRIRELAVQSRNATNSDSDRQALDAEVQLLKAEVQRVAEQTNFNGTPLLNGSFANQAFQVGADQGQVINISQIANANIKDLGNWNRVDTPAGMDSIAAVKSGGITTVTGAAPTASGGGGGTGPTASTASFSATALLADFSTTALDFNVTIGATSHSVLLSGDYTGANGSADLLADLRAELTGFASATLQGGNIVITSDTLGVDADFDVNTFNGVTPAPTVTVTPGQAGVPGTNPVYGTLVAGELTINGVDIGAVTGAATAPLGVDALVTAINGNNDPLLANITASNVNGRLQLKDSTGAEVLIGGSAPAKAGLLNATPVNSSGFVAGSFTVTGSKGTATINFPVAGGAGQRASDLVKAINNQSYNTGVTASLDASGKLQLASLSGNFSVGPAGTGTDAELLANTGLTAGVTGAMDPTQPPAVTVGTGWVAGEAETGFASLDVTNATSADNALAAMDAALQSINAARADLGAIQNRFTSTIANLNTSAENLTAARSRIRDTDYALETAELTRTQILQQAGTAMLAQANQVPQNVLSLLK